MGPDEFREHGHALVEWLAEYMETVESRDVLPSVEPGEIAAKLPPSAPEAGEPFAAILRDLDDVVMPGITHWQHPGWFAYFPANTSPPSVLAELVTAGLGVQGMLWATSPAATEIEIRMVEWMVELLGLPVAWKGSIQSSASDATHLVHVVARRPNAVAYASDQAHSSVARGARVAGYAAARSVPTDARYAMDPVALREMVQADLRDGLTPSIVTSAVGTTGTGAVDPVAAVADVADEFGLWHHVDAAWAGSAMVLPEQRVHQAGVERVDSYTVNPHKWLFTNFDCNLLFVRDPARLNAALDDTPPYLRNAASDAGAVVDLRNWQVPLGRRFRALKLWWVLRSYGVTGLRHHVAEHIALAQDVAARVQAHPSLELVAPLSFALVCFAHVDGDAATDALAERINASGHSAVTPSTVDGRRFIRIAVGQTHTTAVHVDRLWDLIQAG